MRVEFKINADSTEETIIIKAPKMTQELMELAKFLEELENKASLLVVKKDDKLFIIEPNEVDIIRTEGGKIKLYNHKSQDYDVTKPLHEIFGQLPDNFVRISKSAIVNISRVNHLSNSFNGTMYIVMKNGISDYISRKYLGDFKKRLGLKG